MWSKLLTFLSTVVPTFIKKHISVIVLRALGLTGGIWSWIITVGLTALWMKLHSKLHKVATAEDQENIDEKNVAQYKKDKLENAPKEKIIQDETNILNGNGPTE